MFVISKDNNPVNTEIRETVIDAVSNDRFALLNNGVTIVARDVGKVGATFRLKDINCKWLPNQPHSVSESRAPERESLLAFEAYSYW